jgi:CBS domain-containing protein
MSDKRVQDVMTHLVVTMQPDDSIHDCAAALARNHVSGAPVVKDGKVVGMISEADLLMAVFPPTPVHRRLSVLDLFSIVGRERPLHPASGKTVGEAMTHSVISVRPADSIWKAAGVMDRYGIKRLPVTDDDDNLLGIVTRADLVRAMGREDAVIAADVRDAVEVLGPDVFEDLDATCSDGIVTLAGTADRRSTKDIAIKIAGRVPGVIALKDRLDYVVDDRGIDPAPVHGDPWAVGPLVKEAR